MVHFCYIVDDMKFENELIQKAKNGDGDAFFTIGEANYKRRRFYQAMNWYRLGASKNNSASEYQLGAMYENGEGVLLNYKLAMEWYLKAHNNGNTNTTNNIGMLHDQGKGVTQDKNKAFNWLLKATNANNAIAAYNLAMSYEEGQGVDENIQRAIEWYERSAKQVYKEAKYRIEHLNQQGFHLHKIQKSKTIF
jgi:TPR repeat protein